MTTKDIFALIGAIATIAIVGSIVMCAIVYLKECIDNLMRYYRIKHRFDKPPTAKCYCVDCNHHDKETGRCWRFGETTGEYRCTADNWFCWEAEPRKKEN